MLLHDSFTSSCRAAHLPSSTMWFLMFVQSEVRSIDAAAASLKRGQDGNEVLLTLYFTFKMEAAGLLPGGGSTWAFRSVQRSGGLKRGCARDERLPASCLAAVWRRDMLVSDIFPNLL